ncbi:unnamed protein product [Clonostachys rosea f. rosea IK726]|uniref:Uncharacterized protein n=1 Tax=Clonostachys rosea f. rosea IK726 TaxID=1349383 RepID=A0ACA9UJC6_BIOOC|nr:unnamed protein product [Clonostachys rosea f. rosea IK726]
MGLSAKDTFPRQGIGADPSQPLPLPSGSRNFTIFPIPISFSEIGEPEVGEREVRVLTQIGHSAIDADTDGYAQCLATCLPQLMNT